MPGGVPYQSLQTQPDLRCYPGKLGSQGNYGDGYGIVRGPAQDICFQSFHY